MRQGSPKPPINHQLTVNAGGGSDARPLIFEIYETQIGALTPMIAEDLKQAEQDYPRDWIEAAFREAARNNARSWSYVEAILRRWQATGTMDTGPKTNGKKPTKGTDPDVFDRVRERLAKRAEENGQ